MDIQQYITNMKKAQRYLLKFIESEFNSEQNFNTLIKVLDSINIRKDLSILKSFIKMLVQISNYHFRGKDFFERLFSILKSLKKEIKNNFSNKDIYFLFSSNKRLVLFLLEEKILIFDKIINYYLSDKSYYYRDYFSKELYPTDIKKGFEEKRRIGEVDSDIAEIIRNDSIDEFIESSKYNLNGNIYNDCYNTSQVFNLSHNEDDYSISYIRYAAFFGSIQILKYLIEKKVDVPYDIWIYAAYSNNSEVFFLFEENGIEMGLMDSENTFKEAMKCHHNEIATYIQKNYSVSSNYDSDCIDYYNFYFMNSEMIDNDFIKFYEYDYPFALDILKNKKDIDLNEKYISRKIIYGISYFKLFL